MAIAFARGSRVLAAMAKALKIDRPIRSMKVEADCPGPIKITIEFLATGDDEEAVAGALEFYEITSVGVNDSD